MSWMKAELQLNEGDVFIQKTPYTFDVSMCEIFLPLQCGGEIVVIKPEGHKDAYYMKNVIDNRGVTIAFFVPSMLNIFLEHKLSFSRSLKKIVCSGEELNGSIVNKFYENYGDKVELYNMYGPTETAVHVKYYKCKLRISQYFL